MMAIKGVMEQDQPQTGNVQGGQAPPKKGHIIKKRRNRRRRPYPVMVLSWIFRARIEVNYNSLSCIQRVHIQNVQHLHLSGADMNDPEEDDVIEEEASPTKSSKDSEIVKEKND